MNEEISRKISEINELLINHVEKSNDMTLSLMLGLPGIMLYLNYSNVSYGDSIALTFNNLLQNGVEELSYCNGKIGLGFFLNNQDLDIEEYLKKKDTFIYKNTVLSIRVNHDFLHGGIGAILYLADRVSNNINVKKYLNEIVYELYKESKKGKKGIYWEENEFYLEYGEKKEDIVNLSLSHGMAGKIVVFSKLLRSGINDSFMRKLLMESVDFLLNSKNENVEKSVFPHRLVRNNSNSFTRLAWCYGDLGISIALWQAGEAMNNDGIKKESIEICLETTKRKNKEDTGVVDAGICHGSAGIAHIYNRMYRYTGRKEFKQAANYWVEETLKMAKFDDGLAGYKVFHEQKHGGWKNEYGLLEGIAGIGLVLLSHISDVEPSWDRCLLLS